MALDVELAQRTQEVRERERTHQDTRWPSSVKTVPSTAMERRNPGVERRAHRDVRQQHWHLSEAERIDERLRHKQTVYEHLKRRPRVCVDVQDNEGELLVDFQRKYDEGNSSDEQVVATRDNDDEVTIEKERERERERGE
jgi:hypothetical protein